MNRIGGQQDSRTSRRKRDDMRAINKDTDNVTFVTATGLK
jgi:hypothetical protein